MECCPVEAPEARVVRAIAPRISREGFSEALYARVWPYSIDVCEQRESEKMVYGCVES